LLNVQIVIAGVLLAVFLVATAVTVHDFWAISDEQIKMVVMTQFMKNMILAGAALAIAALLDLTG